MIDLEARPVHPKVGREGGGWRQATVLDLRPAQAGKATDDDGRETRRQPRLRDQAGADRVVAIRLAHPEGRDDPAQRSGVLPRRRRAQLCAQSAAEPVGRLDIYGQSAERGGKGRPDEDATAQLEIGGGVGLDACGRLGVRDSGVEVGAGLRVRADRGAGVEDDEESRTGAHVSGAPVGLALRIEPMAEE